MTVKAVVQRQFQRLVDEAADREPPPRPPEGWIRTVRKALGMPGSRLAKKMEVTRARIAHAELAELSGAVTLKSMQSMAKAMGCRFVYAIVPPKHVEDLILAQARKKAIALVSTTSKHMALESQVLPNARIADEVERLTRELAQGPPADLWNDK